MSVQNFDFKQRTLENLIQIFVFCFSKTLCKKLISFLETFLKNRENFKKTGEIETEIKRSRKKIKN